MHAALEGMAPGRESRQEPAFGRIVALGGGRRRIEEAVSDSERRRERYVTPSCPTVLRVLARQGLWLVRIEGDLGGEAATNLADCLLRAACLGARRIVLRPGEADAASSEAEAVLESFARACFGGSAPLVSIRGRGPAARALAGAWHRGRLAVAGRVPRGPKP